MDGGERHFGGRADQAGGERNCTGNRLIGKHASEPEFLFEQIQQFNLRRQAKHQMARGGEYRVVWGVARWGVLDRAALCAESLRRLSCIGVFRSEDLDPEPHRIRSLNPSARTNLRKFSTKCSRFVRNSS